MASYVSYGLGRQRATTTLASTFVATIDGLEKLRAGELAEATRRLENHCFATGVQVLSETGWRMETVRKAMMPSLIVYRRKYRSNSADWTPTEERLEALLTKRP